MSRLFGRSAKVYPTCPRLPGSDDALFQWKHMDKGKGQPASYRLGRVVLTIALLILTSCATNQKHVDQALLVDRGPATSKEDVLASYQVACPDVLQVQIAGRPDLTGPQLIGADGCLDLGRIGRVRIEGLTLSEIGPVVAREVEVSRSSVAVQVAEHRSQQVYLFGEVAGMQRAVPYIGAETVLDLLQRAGGLTPGAAVGNVHLVRSHIADGNNPEVFHVDLKAILSGGDQSTNVRVQPFDQVYVGQSKKGSYQKCVPPCLRHLYETASGMRRP